MPRQPGRHSNFLKTRPLTFSPFARCVAQLASTCKLKRLIQESKSHRKFSITPSDNQYIKHHLKEKIEQSESSDDEDNEEFVQADFAFFDPKPDDFHGVKILLQTYLDDKQWDLSGFVDLILAQTTVGTVVKVEDSEDDGLFSVITALNLGRYKDQRCIMELKEFLLKVCEEGTLSNLKLLLGEEVWNAGLLVSQRVVNLPPQLLPPLYDALFDEVSWATEDEPTVDLRNSFRFKFYLLITKIYKHKNIGQQKHASRSSNEEPIIYIKPEDEIFHKQMVLQFSLADSAAGNS
ncbi:PREDICTED: protein BCCIP homolog isoform X2 [Nelumbo nucifera]|uniref:Protein BCCIP homolog n=1 Tax=Nelumbo nucifera TaxID=4432 RepID=A0A1U8AGR9_NELNU|nr:PREDICTED: protein BCCIP homolog isoform X2 [Nelumbo nucifera]